MFKGMRFAHSLFHYICFNFPQTSVAGTHDALLTETESSVYASTFSGIVGPYKAEAIGMTYLLLEKC